MKIRKLSSLLLLLLCCGCAATKEIPVATEVQVIEKVVTDTIYLEVPYEVIKEVCPELDTLYLETSVSKSMAYLDTSVKVLKGQLENKPIKLEKEIEYIVKDSIVIKEQPVIHTITEYKVPNWSWLFIIISVLLNGLLIFFLIKK